MNDQDIAQMEKSIISAVMEVPEENISDTTTFAQLEPVYDLLSKRTRKARTTI